MKGERIEVFPGPNGKWYWHHKAANNEIVDQGQGYADKDNAWQAAERRRENMPEVPIYEVE